MSATTPKMLAGCPYCGPWTNHVGICPKVQEIEYYPNGMVKRVALRGDTGG